MPPRIPSLLSSLPSSSSFSSPASSSSFTSTHHSLPLLLSSLSLRTPPSRCKNPHLPRRHTSILSSLADAPGAYNRRIRRGRGPSSGKGKTSGRGHKGQKQHGKVPRNFQGGQTPLEIVHGKRGFENVFTVPFSVLNLGKLQSWVDQGRLRAADSSLAGGGTSGGSGGGNGVSSSGGDGTGDGGSGVSSGGDNSGGSATGSATSEAWVTVKELVETRCIHGVKAGGVKLLAGESEGELRSRINIVVARASEEAIRKIEARGGKVVTRYYGKSSGSGVGGGVRRVVRGEMDPVAGLGIEMGGVVDGEATTTTMEEVVGAVLKKKEGGKEKFKFRLPDPTSRKDLEYYRDERKRGYLSHLVPEGEGPSLFFKTPGKKRSAHGGKAGGASKGGQAQGKAKDRGENRIF